MKIKPIRRSLGLMLLVDGIRAFRAPEIYARKLQRGTPLVDDILEYFAENPHLTVRFSLAEIALGLWLILK